MGAAQKGELLLIVRLLCTATQNGSLKSAVEDYCAARYIKVTICARVQFISGLNVVSLVPTVTPQDTAHTTASEY